MFLTYVWHCECAEPMAGRGPAELQPSVSDTHGWSPLLPAVLNHFKCGLCMAVANAGSLSSDLCLASHLHFSPSLCTQGTDLNRGVGASSSQDFRSLCGVRRRGVPVSCESRNQTVGTEIEEALSLLPVLAFPRHYISVVGTSTNRKLTWMWKENSKWLISYQRNK